MYSKNEVLRSFNTIIFLLKMIGNGVLKEDTIHMYECAKEMFLCTGQVYDKLQHGTRLLLLNEETFRNEGVSMGEKSEIERFAELHRAMVCIEQWQDAQNDRDELIDKNELDGQMLA